jgi:hypothetical protein
MKEAFIGFLLILSMHSHAVFSQTLVEISDTLTFFDVITKQEVASFGLVPFAYIDGVNISH